MLSKYGYSCIRQTLGAQNGTVVVRSLRKLSRNLFIVVMILSTPICIADKKLSCVNSRMLVILRPSTVFYFNYASYAVK